MNTMKHSRGIPKVLKLAEVASILRLGRVTIWRLATSGKLKAFRAGKGWRVLRDDLDTFIKKGGSYDGRKKQREPRRSARTSGRSKARR